jgi:N-acetylglucosamine malate deacetylase 1
VGSRILCLHAHPDDAELLAGGTLALLSRRGHTVIIASMTAGDCGSSDMDPQQTADTRRQEAARSAAIIGAEYHSLGFGDLAIFVDDASRRRVTATIRRVRPDIVLTASPADYHCDHEATSRLVTDACFGSSAPNYLTQAYEQSQALPAVPHLYYMDPAEGLDREGRVVRPDFLVDVESVLDTKRAMLAMHHSQQAWLEQQHGIKDFIGEMESWTRSRGALGGLPYAEGFRQYVGHAYPRSPLLQGLLADHVMQLRKSE